jgi:hypothetical protein
MRFVSGYRFSDTLTAKNRKPLQGLNNSSSASQPSVWRSASPLQSEPKPQGGFSR